MPSNGVDQAARLGGGIEEYDLFDHPGGYIRLMDKNAAGRLCQECGQIIEKIQCLGGARYFGAHCLA
jgi:hypothetical protein